MASAPTFTVSAELNFSAAIPAHDPFCGTLTAKGHQIEVRVHGSVRPDPRRDAKVLRGVASALHDLGITVVVYVDDKPMVEVGRTTTLWWQRLLARSPHVRVISSRGVAHLAMGAPRRGTTRASLADLMPPLTLLPLAPTFGSDRRPVTTTHDPRRGGNPRLVAVSPESGIAPGTTDATEIVFPLRQEITLIGSGEQCDIRLAGLEEVHAAVIHDERDEMVVRDRSQAGTTSVNGAPPGEGVVLRTGARIGLGDTTLVYRRAEYADHGRPFGGRVGGELGHQRRQPDPRAQRAASRSLLSIPLKLRTPR